MGRGTGDGADDITRYGRLIGVLFEYRRSCDKRPCDSAYQLKVSLSMVTETGTSTTPMTSI